MSAHIVRPGADGCHSVFELSLAATQREAPVTDFLRIVDVDTLRVGRMGDVLVVRHDDSLSIDGESPLPWVRARDFNFKVGILKVSWQRSVPVRQAGYSVSALQAQRRPKAIQSTEVICRRCHRTRAWGRNDDLVVAWYHAMTQTSQPYPADTPLSLDALRALDINSILEPLRRLPPSSGSPKMASCRPWLRGISLSGSQSSHLGAEVDSRSPQACRGSLS